MGGIGLGGLFCGTKSPKTDIANKTILKKLYFHWWFQIGEQISNEISRSILLQWQRLMKVWVKQPKGSHGQNRETPIGNTKLPNTGMVTTDIGNAKTFCDWISNVGHFVWQRYVNNVYNKFTADPAYGVSGWGGPRIILTFDNMGSGLSSAK